MARHVPRIYTENLEGLEFEIPRSSSLHLVSVLRLRENDEFVAFNKESGEWQCVITKIKRQDVWASKIKLLRENQEMPPLCLAFCLIKPDDAKLAVEKATELGVTDIYPIISKFSYHSINLEKIRSVSIGSSEQSERLDVPTIHPTIQLTEFIKNLPENILWISAVERMPETKSLNEISMKDIACGFIIGPAGGFSDDEKKLLETKTTAVTISRNILRAETAAIMCLAFYNAHNC